MADPKPEENKAVTPAKLALIGVLALVLVGSIYSNFFSGGGVGPSASYTKNDSDDSNEKNRLEDKMGLASSKGANLNDINLRLRTKPWPEITIAKTVSYDPFALPAAFPKPVEPTEELAVTSTLSPDASAAALANQQATLAQERLATLERMRTKSVQAILKNKDNYIAVIDNKEVRVGDKVGEFTVVHISATGVTLEESDQEEPVKEEGIH